MDLGLLATRGNILSMSKEERKKFFLITIKYLLVSLVLTTLVALGTILQISLTTGNTRMGNMLSLQSVKKRKKNNGVSEDDF